jgi:hypothetical protein
MSYTLGAPQYFSPTVPYCQEVQQLRITSSLVCVRCGIDDDVAAHKLRGLVSKSHAGSRASTGWQRHTGHRFPRICCWVVSLNDA